MSRSLPLEEQITLNLKTAMAALRFGGQSLWLTFYLNGDPSRLGKVADELALKGWSNTDGWEGAFLYPKVEVVRSAAAIIETSEFVIGLCDGQGVEVINIDADTSPDVAQSKFVTLYWA